MGRKACLYLCVFCWVVFFGAGESLAQDDVADVPSNEFFAGGDKNKRYFLIGGGEGARVPKRGFSLLIVLPGGDGGVDFNPFVKRIYKNSLSKKYLVAELVSVKWTANQVIVWPTSRSKVDKQKFSTEEFVEAVVEDVKARYKLNKQNIFTLSWSSGGPAAYAISVQEEKSVVGSYIAMSVFKPDELGSLSHAAGHFYFIEHSPEDKVCPFRMAKNAHKMLREHGGGTKLVTYKGGHGWHGNVFGRIHKGIRWLEVAVRKQSRKRKPVERKTKPAAGEKQK
jgi:predicted esterase